MRFPDIDLKIKQNEEATEIVYSYETWVRVKRKSIWYEVRVFENYRVRINNEPFQLVNLVILNDKKFIKLCYEVITCIVITKKDLEDRYNYRISDTKLSEKDRIYIKHLVEDKNINSIL